MHCLSALLNKQDFFITWITDMTIRVTTSHSVSYNLWVDQENDSFQSRSGLYPTLLVAIYYPSWSKYNGWSSQNSIRALYEKLQKNTFSTKLHLHSSSSSNMLARIRLIGSDENTLYLIAFHSLHSLYYLLIATSNYCKPRRTELTWW